METKADTTYSLDSFATEFDVCIFTERNLYLVRCTFISMNRKILLRKVKQSTIFIFCRTLSRTSLHYLLVTVS